MKGCSVFCFHLGCVLGLYLLHTIQMLLRRQNYEYSCWLSTLFCYGSIYTLSFQHFLCGMGKRSGTCRGQFVISWSAISQNLEESEQGEFPLTCPSPHNVAMRWRGHNPNLLMGKEAQNLYFFNGKLKRLGYQPIHWPPVVHVIELEAQSLAKWQLHTMPWPVLGN